jgi:hypothetical protein
LVRLGLGSLAAGGAAFAVGFVVFTWLPHDAGPVDPATRDPQGVAVSTSTAIKSKLRYDGTDVASHKADDRFALPWPEARSQPTVASASFGERFGFDRPAAARPAAQAAQATLAFNDRFGGEDLGDAGPVRSAVAEQRTTFARASTTAPRPPARSVIAQAAPKRAVKAGFQLASASDTPMALGYAPDESANGAGVTDSLKGLVTKDADPFAEVDTRRTAIYDISSRVVYLPNGRRLEAHSGLGRHMDNPRSVGLKNVGATPPNVYDLKMRESLFHGVRALRLIPKDNAKMYGRDGILAHTYMLGPNGQSNGCVSFSDYSAFLDAYLRGDVTRLVVVERLAGAPPSPKTAADWFSNTLNDIFRRS